MISCGCSLLVRLLQVLLGIGLHPQLTRRGCGADDEFAEGKRGRTGAGLACKVGRTNSSGGIMCWASGMVELHKHRCSNRCMFPEMDFLMANFQLAYHA